MTRSNGVAATVAATRDKTTPRIEIVGDRRRAHDPAFRAMVVAEANEPGARVRDVAARHGVCASLLYRWRRDAGGSVGSGLPMHLLPLRIVPAVEGGVPETAAPRGAASAKRRRAGVIEIELDGGIRVKVGDDVSAAALRRVISVLRG